MADLCHLRGKKRGLHVAWGWRLSGPSHSRNLPAGARGLVSALPCCFENGGGF